MTEQLRAYLAEQAQHLDDSVRQLLEIAQGDAVAAIRTVLIANIFLHEENDRLKRQISSGFTRGRVKKAAQ